MDNLPENATIVKVEGTNKYYIRVDRGGVSFFFDPGDMSIEELIQKTTGQEDPQILKQIENDSTEDISEYDFEKQFVDDDLLVYVGEYDALSETWTDILDSVKNISERETWWGDKEFRDEYVRIYELNLNEDGVLESREEFFADLRASETIAANLGTKKSFFNRAIDERLDPEQYGQDLETQIGAVKAAAMAAGVSVEDLTNNKPLADALKLIASNLNNDQYGNPNTKAAVTKATQQVVALVDPAFRAVNGGIYNLDEDIAQVSNGITGISITTKHDEVEELLQNWLPQNMWGDIDIAKEASKLRMNPNYKYELEEKLKEKRFANYGMYDKNISWLTILNNKKGAIKTAWGIDVKWDNPVLDEIIKMNDTTKENEYLRGKGMELGIDKVKNDFALAQAGAYGSDIVKSQSFLEN